MPPHRFAIEIAGKFPNVLAASQVYPGCCSRISGHIGSASLVSCAATLCREEGVKLFRYVSRERSNKPQKNERLSLHYQTYKATIIREGVFASKSAGDINVNAEIGSNFTSKLAPRWNRVFNELLLKQVLRLHDDVRVALREFAPEVGQVLERHGVLASRYEGLLSNLQERFLGVSELHSDVTKMMKEDVTSLVTSIVKNAIQPVYRAAKPPVTKAPRVRGAEKPFDRMKRIMEQNVERLSPQIFRQVAKEVSGEADKLVQRLRATMDRKFARLEKDLDMCLNRFWENYIFSHAAATKDRRVALASDLEQYLEEIQNILFDLGVDDADMEV